MPDQPTEIDAAALKPLTAVWIYIDQKPYPAIPRPGNRWEVHAED